MVEQSTPLMAAKKQRKKDSVFHDLLGAYDLKPSIQPHLLKAPPLSRAWCGDQAFNVWGDH